MLTSRYPGKKERVPVFFFPFFISTTVSAGIRTSPKRSCIPSVTIRFSRDSLTFFSYPE